MIKNIVFFKIFQETFCTSKTRNTCIRTLDDDYVYKTFKSLPWKTAEFCRFECPEMPLLRYLQGFRHFFLFSFCVRFGPFKMCSTAIFCVLDENMTQKHVPHQPKTNF